MQFFGIINRLRAQLQDEFAPKFVRIEVKTGWDPSPESMVLTVGLYDLEDFRITKSFDKSKTIEIPLDPNVIDAMGKTEDDLFKYVKLAIEFQVMTEKETKTNE